MTVANSNPQALPNRCFVDSDAGIQTRSLVLRIRRVLLLVVGWMTAVTGTADLLNAESPHIQVTRIGGLFSEPDSGSSHLRLDLKVQVQNRTDSPFTPSRDSFRLLVNGMPGGMLSGAAMKEIPPGETSEVALIFSDIDPGDGSFPEPELTLLYQSDTGPESDPISIDLNQVLRDTTPLSTESVGPNGCVTILRMNRDLDIPSVWLLSERLRQVISTPCRRIVVAAENIQQRLHVSIFEEWIRNEYLPESPGSLLPEQRLIDVRVAGFTYPGTEYGRRPGQTRGNEISRYDRADDAVRDALRPIYRFVSSQTVLEDIQSGSTVVKSAAASSVDRLDRDQQQILFNTLLADADQSYVAVIPELHRCTSPEVTKVLQKLAVGGKGHTGRKGETATAAVRCLAHSSSPDVHAIFEELWRHPDVELAASLQDSIVNATIDIDDHRWASFVALWVETKLKRVSGEGDGTHNPTIPPGGQTQDVSVPSVDDRGDPAADVPAPAQSPDEPDAREGQVPINRSEIEQLTLALAYLRAHGDASALDIQREWLLKITIPQIQDVVVQNIWGWQQAEDESLVRAYIRTRLSNGQITDTTRNAVLIFPDREWADALLKDFRQASTPAHARRRSLQSALRCSDAQALHELVSSIDSLDPQSQGFLLEHLAAVGYPDWHRVAERLFGNNGPLFHQLMDILLADGSEQSVLIMTRRLNQLITPAPGSREISPENRMHAERLISRVSLFVHPEARKVLNRCARSTDEIIRGRTNGAFAAAARRSPSEQSFGNALSLYYAGEFKKALEAVDQAILLDELRASLYLLRGEILLRLNSPDEAEVSLMHADFLNPESPSVWLQIALLKVHQSESDQGVRLVEAALELNEADPVQFVSAAAVFSESAGRCMPSEETRRAMYVDEAFANLTKAVTLGFSNLSRLEHDPAFLAIKPDPRWKQLVSP